MLDRFSSDYAVFSALCTLKDKHADELLFGDRFIASVYAVQEKMPEKYLPDLYMEAPLQGEKGIRSFFLLHPQEYMRLLHETRDSYFCKEGALLKDLSHAKYGEAVTGFAEENGIASPFSAFYHKLTAVSSPGFIDGRTVGQAVLPEAILKENLQESSVQLRELVLFLNSLDGNITFVNDTEDHDFREFFFVPHFLTDADSFIDCTGRRKIHAFLREHHMADDRTLFLDKLPCVYAIPAEKGEGERNAPPVENLGICVGYYRFRYYKNGKAEVYAGIKLTANLCPDAFENRREHFAFQWHITDLCDQRCKHCYLFGKDPSIVCTSMPFEELCRTLDNLTEAAAAYGINPKLVITGGDPVLHPQFWELASLLHERGDLWGILGNPFHITDETADRLARLGCSRYQLSMDGLEPFHDRLRKPGSFQETLRATGVLKRAGIETTYMATASRENLGDILSCMDIAAEMGVDIFTFARYCAPDRQKAEELYPTPSEYRNFLLSYYTKAKELGKRGFHTSFILKEHLFELLRWELGEIEIPPAADKVHGTVLDGCHLGQSVVILPNGELMACRRMNSPVGNVKTQAVIDVLDGKECMRYRDVSKIEGCSVCELKNLCRGCRAVGYNVTGNLQGKDPMCWYDPIKKGTVAL